MAAAALTPRVRMMAVCDRIRESRTEAGVFNLKGVRQSLRAEIFPFLPRRLWLFLLMSSPRAGDFPCYVRVVNDRSERTVFYSYLNPRPTFETDNGLFRCSAAIRCSFLEEGQYTVQAWFFQAHGNDVLKGEMPFYISAEQMSP